MKERISEVQMICISLRAIFERIQEGGFWSDGSAEAQVSAYWLENCLLRRYSHDPDNVQFVRNTFRTVKEGFDRAWDSVYLSAETGQ